MHNLTDIIDFVSQKTACDNVTEISDIEKDLGCYGDDFDELVDEYSKIFNVNMSSYLWYFHTREEGNSFGGTLFKAPNERVKRIPLTPILLLDFAKKGKWDLKYPQHTIPKKRYDLLINLILVCLAVAYGIYYWFIK